MAVPLRASVAAWALLALLALNPAIARAVESAGVVGRSEILLPWLRMHPYEPLPHEPGASPAHVHSLVPDQLFTRCAGSQDHTAVGHQNIKLTLRLSTAPRRST